MLLVLDTCFNACSAALYDDAEGVVVAAGYEAMERGHAEALGPMTERLFIEAGVKPYQLSRIAVTYGPGTFTGLRIGLSFAKGMALALNIPLIGIDSFTATAVSHFDSADRIVVAHKAGGTGLFYWCVFERGAMSIPALGSTEEIAAAMGQNGIPLNDAKLDAKDFSAFAATLPISGKTVEPLYLRPPDARPSASVEAATARIRISTADDVAAMAGIHGLSFAKGWTAEDLTSTLSVPGAAALVVELAGTTYGFVQFQWVAGEAEINTICVLPNYRRQHFGQDLMRGLIVHLQAMGTTKLFLEVAENNGAARGLYESFGFQVSGQRKAYYADGQNAVTMIKEFGA